MDRDRFDATIVALMHRQPFQPFTVALVNGDRVEIDHPDALAYRDGLVIFASPGGAPVFFDNEGVSEVIGDLAERNGK